MSGNDLIWLMSGASCGVTIFLGLRAYLSRRETRDKIRCHELCHDMHLQYDEMVKYYDSPRSMRRSLQTLLKCYKSGNR